MVRRLFCLLAVLAIAGIASAHLVAHCNFDDACYPNAVLLGGAQVIDLDPDARGTQNVLKLDYGDGTVHQYMDWGPDWANWNGVGIGNLEPLTIAAWIQVTPGTTGGWRTIISKGWESSWCLAMGTQGGAGDDKIAFSAHRGVAAWSPITGSVNVRDGRWHHVVGVVESEASAKLYIDGVFQGSSTCWMGVNYNEEHVLIGDDPLKTDFNYQWNGMLDDIRVYDEALSEQDVQDLYLANCCFYTSGPFLLEITGPEEAAESSQLQYTATALIGGQCGWLWPNCGPDLPIPPVDVTAEATWWVEPETFASIDGSGLLTIGNIDTSQSITVYAQYTSTLPANVTVETEKAVDLCCSGDLNDDGKIDLGDYAILAQQWLEAPGAPSADIAPFCSGDGIVDINDLGLFVDQWSGIFNYGASIVYEISDCGMDLSAVGQSGQTRFSVTVEGRYIDFEDMMTANCCPDELELQMTVEDNLITVYEIEHVTRPCRCICDYPVTARLGPFEPGVYTLEVYEDWGGFIGSTIVVIEP